MTTIRHAVEDDAPALPALEASAGLLFKSIPALAFVADHAPTSEEEHLVFIRTGICLIAEHDGKAVGFLVADQQGSELHIWEMAVARDHQQHGHGKRLIHAAIEHASANGLKSVSLTTFRNVPWNGPFYARLGFKEPSIEANARLADLLTNEAARGLPDRCAMRFTLR